jgi:hypothetical protein
LNNASIKQKGMRELGDLKALKIASDLAWLSEVEEVGPPEHLDCRIWVKSGIVRSGNSTIPHRH